MSLELRKYERSQNGSKDKIVQRRDVNVVQLIAVQWCRYTAELVNLWKQKPYQWRPEYKNDKIVCDLKPEMPEITSNKIE